MCLFPFILFNYFFKQFLLESSWSRIIPGFWEFQNCKDHSNRTTGSEDSFSDTGLSSNAISAISVIAAIADIATNSVRDFFSNFLLELRPVSQELSSLPMLRFGRFLQFWNSQNPGIILEHKDSDKSRLKNLLNNLKWKHTQINNFG